MVLPPHWVAETGFVVLTLLYALVFRPYWVIIAAFYVMWRLFFTRYRQPVLAFLLLVLAYLVLQIVFMRFLEVGLTANRTVVNEGRAGVDVGSLITDPLPADPVLMVPNAMILFLWLLIPIPLLFTPSPFYFFSAAVIAFLWANPLIHFLRLSRSRASRVPEPGFAQSARITRRWRSASLLLAMVSVQAIFEPDYGSYLKHLTPMMPLFLALVPERTPASSLVNSANTLD
jgi:hypothetical protein